MTASATLLIIAPDRRGLVAAVANFLHSHQANILHADQHIDGSENLFFMRVEWDLKDFDLHRDQLAEEFCQVAEPLNMEWRIEYSDRKPRVAIMVSRQDHCLVDLLYRHHAGELNCEIPLIISNHDVCRPLAEFHGIPFHHIPVVADHKPAAELQQLELLKKERVDTVVLARYMQILSAEFIAHYPRRIINIHHSFLPAFTGARPYHRAYDRGVKLIGATSHYVTEVLDDGPIIEQDVSRVSHRDQVDDLIEQGRDLERVVLSRALRWHIDHRILTYGNKTVVFD
ncbi:MAG TPA: formyltetrahydrofolate deformylase [Gammaproteobacteria bacterium]|nr:formyltetrahydrofolate deformylase [Gammaproteobacteria bacterium]